VLDLQGVDWIDRGGFALILRWWEQSQSAGGRFGLCLSPSTREVVALTRLDRMIPCFLHRSEAVLALSQPARGLA
jgi:anti-anti-sigma regulatory factor